MDALAVSLTAAVRCHVEPLGERPVRRKVRKVGWRSQRLGERVLVLDTETTTDRFQNLLVAYYELYEHAGDHYERVESGLIAGEAPTAKERRTLRAYANRQDLRVLPQADFVRQVFLPEVYRSGTLCVGFNLPFDLSRLAVRRADSRGTSRGGFTFYLTPDLEDPPIRVKALDSKRAFISFGSPWRHGRREAEGVQAFGGRFLDLKTLAHALTGESHTLESACETFQVRHPKGRIETYGVVSDDLLDYLRRDVLASAELYQAMLVDWNRHPFAPVPTPWEIEQDPASVLVTKAFSPATLAKGYLGQMGVVPRLRHQPRFSKRILGHAMAAYFGGRSECHVRRQPVRVTYLDVLSMYPTVSVLMRIFRLMVADRITVQDASDEARRFLRKVTLEDVLAPATWQDLCVLAEVEPDDNVLPLRAAYQEDGDFQIGLNVVSATEGIRLYYMLPDLVVSKLLGDKVPHIRRAWRFRPEGWQPGLRPVTLVGGVRVDPRRDDFIRLLIERRHQVQRDQREAERRGDAEGARHLEAVQNDLKIVANSVYGVLAEVDDEARTPRKVEVFGVERFVSRATRDERSGLYAFGPLAALITSGARLMLGIVEKELQRRGATYAFCDTDSMAVVGGSEIVDAVRKRLARLVPYGFGGELLKVEDENFALIDPRNPRRGIDRSRVEPLYCYAVSAKRYALYNLAKANSIVIRRASEHGLGHLRSPTPRGEAGWIERTWTAIIQGALGRRGQDVELPFGATPALAQVSISKPPILKLFDRLNAIPDRKTGKRVAVPYARQMKPFNFMLVAFPDTGDITTGGEAYWEQDGAAARQEKGLPIRPIAPYESDPRKWRGLPWVDRHTSRPVRLAWRRETDGTVTQAIRVQTYDDVLRRHAIHPEAKAAGPDGKPCGPHTSGELGRLHVRITDVQHIGKESHELEEVQAGLEHAASTYARYPNPRAAWTRDRRVLRLVPRKLLAQWSGLHVRSIKAMLNTNRLPYPKNLHTLHAIAERLRKQGS